MCQETTIREEIMYEDFEDEYLEDDEDEGGHGKITVLPIYTKVIGNLGLHIEYLSTGTYCLYMVEMPSELYSGDELPKDEEMDPESLLQGYFYLNESGEADDLDVPPLNCLYMTPILFEDFNAGIAYVKECLKEMKKASTEMLKDISRIEVGGTP